MGMFVTGSIIRPRIFISTSMAAYLELNGVLAHQAVRRCASHARLHVGSQKFLRRVSKIYDAMRTGISGPLVLAARFSAGEDFNGLSAQRQFGCRLDFPVV